MKKSLGVRLVIDFFLSALLLLCFSYYWLGNNWHEIIGTAFFIFLGVHNFLNIRWFKSIKNAKKELKEFINMGNIFFLILLFLILFITSFLISKNVNSLLKINAGFTVRQIHVLVSYYLLVIVSIHIGLRWTLVMNYFKSRFKISISNVFWRMILFLFNFTLACAGIYGSFKLDIGTRLSMKMTLDWWDFHESVLMFFVYLISVMGLYVILTHYFFKILSKKN